MLILSIIHPYSARARQSHVQTRAGIPLAFTNIGSSLKALYISENEKIGRERNEKKRRATREARFFPTRKKRRAWVNQRSYDRLIHSLSLALHYRPCFTYRYIYIHTTHRRQSPRKFGRVYARNGLFIRPPDVYWPIGPSAPADTYQSPARGLAVVGRFSSWIFRIYQWRRCGWPGVCKWRLLELEIEHFSKCPDNFYYESPGNYTRSEYFVGAKSPGLYVL